MGSNPIWGSDFFRVLLTFNLSYNKLPQLSFDAVHYITQSLTFCDRLFIYMPKDIFKYPAFFIF